jgi:plastocyanin
VLVAIGILSASTFGWIAIASAATQQMVIVPGEDRFTPFHLTVHAGDTVEFVNQDTDDHTVVSDKKLNTLGLRLNKRLPGTDKNHGQPGTLDVSFPNAGTFVYYCRFHSKLDKQHQPTAPGPRGGIQDKKGNFGTPMMGVISVEP